MTTAKEIHDFMRTQINKGQGRYFTPEQLDTAWNNASLDKFNQEKRRFEVSGNITSSLRNFKKDEDVSLTTGSGDLPSDYDYITNVSANGVPVDILTEGEWVDALVDELEPPTEDYPICNIRKKIEVAPSSIAEVKVYYLSKPKKMVFGYNLVSNRPVYDAGTSTDPDWPESAIVDVTLRALAYMGFPLKDEVTMRSKNFKNQTEGV